MAKLAPRDLAQVLGALPSQPKNDNVLVGYDKADDAGVFRLRDDVALVQTVDFFTPVTDDPELYGRIAANNSLNDIYAMGGKPLTALSIVCYPQKEDMDVLGQILRGGQQAMNEAGVIVLGGHSIDDAEIKFGYAVTGLINPARVVSNANAQPGDVLILTKPIGTGAISTGIKRGVARAEAVNAAMKMMTTSAATAAEAMQAAEAHACTDITGFGLLGHAYEMARASDVCLVIEAARVPLLPDVLELIAQGMLTRGDKNNREYVGDTIELADRVSREMQSALFDPQTAGGLLISIDLSKAETLIDKIDGAVIIGEVQPKTGRLIRVV
ncbi:MAG TPA: selenide, water dikinase SelD [Pyrinomonadaceae bacterium]|nr:selenide, water dikinase SelD [Pyrinomonadaceae bacterium]